MEPEPLPGIFNFSSVVITFVVTLALGALAAGWPRPLQISKRKWKAIEVLTVLLGLLGLYPQMAEMQRFVLGNTARQRAGRVDFFYQNLKRDTVVYQPAACFKATRSQFSPSDFDLIEAEKQRLCDLLKEAQAALPAEPPATLEIWQKLRTTDLKDDYAAGMLKQVIAAGDYYLRVKSEDENLRKAATERTSTELNLLMFSPYALAVAAALIIVKICFGPS